MKRDQNVQAINSSLAEIDREIRDSKNAVWVWAVLILALYAIWFYAWQIGYVTDSPASGGVLGDYFGGLLNPVVALVAFYWLTKGVRIQKQELAETKGALQQQVNFARISVRIDALSALIEAHTADISYRREHLAFLLDQKTNPSGYAYYSMRGKPLDNTQFAQMVKDLNAGINIRVKERIRFAAELRMLLNASRTEDDKVVVQEWIQGATLVDDEEV